MLTASGAPRTPLVCRQRRPDSGVAVLSARLGPTLLPCAPGIAMMKGDIARAPASTCLCAALKSMLAPTKAPGVSSGCVDSARSDWQAGQGAALSLLQKRHLICLVPKGHFFRASAMLRPVSTIQLLAISLRSKLCTVSGSSLAIFQLPSQISRSGGRAESGFFAGGSRQHPVLQKWQQGHLGHPKSWPRPAAGGVCTAALPRGSCLEGRAILELCKLKIFSDGERGQSGELLLMCARIRGTNLRSCIQCSQGLATACSGCSGLGQHQSAEECIPAPSQVGSLQGASVMVLEISECNGSVCWKEPVLLTLPMPTWASCRAREGGYSAVRVLIPLVLSRLQCFGACMSDCNGPPGCILELLQPNAHDLEKPLLCVQASTHTRPHCRVAFGS